MKDGKLRALEERIDQLESRPTDFVDAVRRKLAQAHGLEVSRRDVIVGLTSAGISGAALLALTPGQAAAAVVGNIGTNADPLDTVYTQNVDPGTSGSAVNIPAVTTEDLDVENISTGTIKELFETTISSDKDYSKAIQFTDGVSTSAKTILAADDVLSSGFIGLGATVIGREPDDGHRFVDSIISVRGSVTVVGSDTNGSADGRTYSYSTGDIQLAMAADTYNVVCIADISRVV